MKNEQIKQAGGGEAQAKPPRKQYNEQFRRNAVALVETTGRPLSELAEQLGVTHWNLRDWLKRYGKKGARTTSADELRAAIVQLQQENEKLRAERDVLKKAMGILATPKPSVTR
jgi:transposase